MEIKGKRTLQAGRLFEVLQKTAALGALAECGCCLKSKPARNFAYVESYKPRDPAIIRAMPPENIAAYAVCSECADTLPEDTVFKRCEKMLIGRGLLKGGQKPLNVEGSHAPRKPASEGPRIITNE